MRRVLFALACVVFVLLASAGRSSAGADPSEAGLASAPSESVEPVEPASHESLPLRLGKAAAFGIVVSAILLAGGMWRRGRRKPKQRRK